MIEILANKIGVEQDVSHDSTSYIDPSSGSLIFQVAAGAILACRTSAKVGQFSGLK